MVNLKQCKMQIHSPATYYLPVKLKRATNQNPQYNRLPINYQSIHQWITIIVYFINVTIIMTLIKNNPPYKHIHCLCIVFVLLDSFFNLQQ